MAAEDIVTTYTNYAGAEVVNDCPECDQSHFLTDLVLNADGDGEYKCGDETIHIHSVGGG